MISQISSSPLLSEMKAILRPSGDQRAHLSCALDEPGQVARGALFDRRREDVAPGHEQRPLTLRGERPVLDVPRRRHLRGPVVEPLVRNLDRDRAGLARAGVQDLQLAVHLIDDLPGRVRARPAHVPLLALGDRLDRAARRVVDVEVQGAGAVGVEEDLVADPHGVAVGARVRADVLRVVGGEVEEVEVLLPAALVALPGPEVAGDGVVDDPLAVGREVARARDGHGQRARPGSRPGGRCRAACPRGRSRRASSGRARPCRPGSSPAPGCRSPSAEPAGPRAGYQVSCLGTPPVEGTT